MAKNAKCLLPQMENYGEQEMFECCEDYAGEGMCKQCFTVEFCAYQEDGEIL